MGKLIFTYTEKHFIDNNREANKIELDVPDDMNIEEYKVICVRLASAIGYSETSITKVFGKISIGEGNINTIKDLLNGLNITENTNKKN